ncbi:MAG: hypothetical protein Q4Q23_07230 [Methanobacteriaceae archaeon]|nr:hypothetical protein [Methanobacteriaceae archaeon]
MDKKCLICMRPVTEEKKTLCKKCERKRYATNIIYLMQDFTNFKTEFNQKLLIDNKINNLKRLDYKWTLEETELIHKKSNSKYVWAELNYIKSFMEKYSIDNGKKFSTNLNITENTENTCKKCGQPITKNKKYCKKCKKINKTLKNIEKIQEYTKENQPFTIQNITEKSNKEPYQIEGIIWDLEESELIQRNNTEEYTLNNKKINEFQNKHKTPNNTIKPQETKEIPNKETITETKPGETNKKLKIRNILKDIKINTQTPEIKEQPNKETPLKIIKYTPKLKNKTIEIINKLNPKQNNPGKLSWLIYYNDYSGIHGEQYNTYKEIFARKSSFKTNKEIKTSFILQSKNNKNIYRIEKENKCYYVYNLKTLNENIETTQLYNTKEELISALNIHKSEENNTSKNNTINPELNTDILKEPSDNELNKEKETNNKLDLKPKNSFINFKKVSWLIYYKENNTINGEKYEIYNDAFERKSSFKNNKEIKISEIFQSKTEKTRYWIKNENKWFSTINIKTLDNNDNLIKLYDTEKDLIFALNMQESEQKHNTSEKTTNNSETNTDILKESKDNELNKEEESHIQKPLVKVNNTIKNIDKEEIMLHQQNKSQEIINKLKTKQTPISNYKKESWLVYYKDETGLNGEEYKLYDDAFERKSSFKNNNNLEISKILQSKTNEDVYWVENENKWYFLKLSNKKIGTKKESVLEESLLTNDLESINKTITYKKLIRFDKDKEKQIIWLRGLIEEKDYITLLDLLKNTKNTEKISISNNATYKDVFIEYIINKKEIETFLKTLKEYGWEDENKQLKEEIKTSNDDNIDLLNLNSNNEPEKININKNVNINQNNSNEFKNKKAYNIEGKYSQKTINEYKETITKILIKLNNNSKIELYEPIKEYTKTICTQAISNHLITGYNKNILIGSAIYMACRYYKEPRTITEIANVTQTSDKSIIKLSKRLTSELNIKLPFTVPEDYLERFANELELSDAVKIDARQLIKIARIHGYNIHTSPNGVVGAALYITSKNTTTIKEQITQKEIGNIVGVSEVTLRKKVNDLEEFHVELINNKYDINN